MSGDCFIKFEQVPGETEDKEFAGAIDVVGWNWGVERSGNSVIGQKRTRSAADVKAFEFRHHTDSASAGLMQRCYNNTLIKTAVLSMRRAGGKAQKYLEIRFKNVQITRVMLLHDEANEIPVESVTFSFEAVDFDYTMQSKEGADKTGRHSFGWTLGGNE